MIQTLSLFDEPKQRKRVADRIGQCIIDFFRKPAGTRFHASELNDFVAQFEKGVAPDSPSRIMRMLRQEGRINYRVVNRRDSLYQVEAQ